MKSIRSFPYLIFITTLLILFSFAGSAFATAVPQLINYQGFLTDRNGVPRNGVFPIRFAFYDGEDGNPTLWTGSPQDVYVKRGIFSVLIGPIDNPDYVFGEHKDVWMGIKVGDDSEMRPLSRVTSVGYAFNADRVQGQASADNIVPSSGDVGVGTTSPGSKLSVDGDIEVSGSRFHVGTDGNVGIGTTSPSGTLEVSHDGLSPDLVVASDGNVGIGTNNPGATLEVVGNILVDDIYIKSRGWVSELFPELLVNGAHTVDDCEVVGVLVDDGAGNKFCQFNDSSCLTGWTQYESWSTTDTISDTYINKVVTGSCAVGSTATCGTTPSQTSCSSQTLTCTANGHSIFANTAQESNSCSGTDKTRTYWYQGDWCFHPEFKWWHCASTTCSGATSVTVTAPITQIGCY